MTDDVYVFPAGVRRAQPFDSTAAAVLWLRETAEAGRHPLFDYDFPDLCTRFLTRWAPPFHRGTNNWLPTLAPIYSPALVPMLPVSLRTVGETSVWVAEDGTEYPSRELDPYWPWVAGFEAQPVTATRPSGPWSLHSALDSYRRIAGYESMARFIFQDSQGKDRAGAAKVLGTYENALVMADLIAVTSLNAAVTDVWAQVLNAGLPVWPDPANPTTPPTTPAASWQLGT